MLEGCRHLCVCVCVRHKKFIKAKKRTPDTKCDFFFFSPKCSLQMLLTCCSFRCGCACRMHEEGTPSSPGLMRSITSWKKKPCVAVVREPNDCRNFSLLFAAMGCCEFKQAENRSHQIQLGGAFFFFSGFGRCMEGIRAHMCAALLMKRNLSADGNFLGAMMFFCTGVHMVR